MSAAPIVAPPESFIDTLLPVAQLTDAHFELFVSVVTGPRSFALSAKRIKELQKEFPELGPNLAVLLSALAYLYGRLETVARDGGDREAAIASLFDGQFRKPDAPSSLNLKPRVSRLLAVNGGYTKYRKVRRLRGGFLPNATAFHTMVDLRPDFGDEDLVEYRGLVTVVQLRIQTDSDDPQKRETVVQLDEESLTELSSCIDRMQRKLQELKSHPAIGPDIFDVEE